MSGERYRALVAGGTGLVGRRLIARLLGDQACASIAVLARSGRPAALERVSKLEWIETDFERLGETLNGMTADVVFIALGTTMAKAGTREAFRKVDYEYAGALADWAAEAGVRACVVVTAMGASSESVFYYNRVKGDLEDKLARTAIPRIVILRPSLLLGERAEHRRGEKAGAALAKALGWMMVGPLRRYRAVDADDVAEAMRAAGRLAAAGAPIDPPAGLRQGAVSSRETPSGGTVTICESDAISAIAREITR